MKYFSKKVRNEYGVFDSETEYGRFLYLKHLEDIGEIHELKQQVEFEIIPKLMKTVPVILKTKVKYMERVEERAAHYTCDFTYIEKGGKLVIEEVKTKGTMLARDYPLRKKLIKQLIHKHNEDMGFDDWMFHEFVPSPKRSSKKNGKKEGSRKGKVS